MVISHNLAAMNAERQFNIVTNKRKKTTEKLSSGYRINKAADDAAGLAISEKMRRQIRGLTQGVNNTQDGISMCQIADGALEEVDEMLHRVTELSVKSANETNSVEDREYIQKEVSQLIFEIDRISDTTTFNNQKIFASPIEEVSFERIQQFNDAKESLLNGTFRQVTDSLELSNGQFISAQDANTVIKSLSNVAISVYLHTLSDGASNTELFDTLNDKIEIITENNKTYYSYCPSEAFETYMEQGAVHISTHKGSYSPSSAYNDFWSACRTAANNNVATSGGYEVNYVSGCGAAAMMQYGFTRRDHDDRTGYAAASFAASAWHVLNDAGISGTTTNQYIDMLNPAIYCDVRVCYNLDDAVHAYLSLFEGKLETTEDDGKKRFWIQSGAESGDGITLAFGCMNSTLLGIKGINVSTRSGAQEAINISKSALTTLSSIRSEIGAQQNRLEHTIANEKNIVENTTAAESLIKDTDIAKELVQNSQHDILSQAEIAMLSQANQSSQGVLRLLQ